MKEPIHLERRDADGSHWWAYLTRAGRDILAASGTVQTADWGDPPPFAATGLACRDCYAIHADGLAEVLWMLVDRRRRRAMRQAYRRRRR